MTKRFLHNDFIIEQLEPRLLFSADSGLLPIDAFLPHDDGMADFSVVEAALVPGAGSTILQVDAEQQRHEIVFVDSNVSDYEQLVDDILADRNDGRQIDVVVLDSSYDGIEQISETLNRYEDIDAVHIISHGTDGAVQLGNTVLNLDTVGDYAESIAGWQDALSNEADLLFYGCDLAAGEDGKVLIDNINTLTGADVAASDDPTGHALLGGDWNLEYSTGTIETGSAVSVDVQQHWSHVMVTDTVRDEFNTAGAFTGNNGTQSWTGNWQEVGESDGASSGKVRVTGSPAALRIGGAGMISGKGALREADISGATSATLTLEAWRSASRAASITLAVSDNGGTDWTDLQTWSFSSLTSSPSVKTFDITAYKSANTQIRFLGSGEADSAHFYADNVQIEYTTGGTATSIGDATLPDRNVWGGGLHFGVNAFTLATNSGTDTLTDLTVSFTGTDVNDVDASGVKIWRDDGSTANKWDDTDTLIGTASFVGNTASFTGLSENITTSSTQYIVTYDIADTATAGNTLQGSVTAATVSNTLVNNDSVDSTLTVIADSVHETSVYKAVFSQGALEELYLKQSSSPTTNILEAMSLGSVASGTPGSMLMSWDPDATTTTLVDNSTVKQVQMAGMLIDSAGDSYGTVTTIINFYEDRVLFDVTATLSTDPGGVDWMFMTYADWDDAVLDETFQWSSNNSGTYNSEDPAPNFNSGDVTTPISYQGLFELGATDGLVNATLQNISNYDPAQIKNTDDDISGVDIAFQKIPGIGTTYQTSVMYSFGTTTTGFDTATTEERQDGFISPATLNFGISGGDGILVGDGYSELRGAYTLDDDDADDHVRFEFQTTTTHHAPAFEITNWDTSAPTTIIVNGLIKNIGTDYNAAVEGTTLYLQYLSDLSSNTTFTIADNYSPTVGGTVAGQTVNDTATISPFSGVTIGDADNPAQTLAVSVTLDTAAKGAFTTLNGFTDAGGGVYTFSGTAAAATTAIQGMVFDPADNRVAPTLTETTTFTISVNDGSGPVTDNTTTVISTSMNDIPTIGGTAAGQTVNDTATISPFSGVTIGDVDNPAQTLSVSVTLDTAAKGAFTTLNGFTDAGGGVYTFSGTASAATTAIQGMVFDPADNRVAPTLTETTTFTISVNDGSGPVTDNTTTVISTSINDAPKATNVSTAEIYYGATTLNLTDIVVSDVDSANVTVTLTLSDIAAGSLSTGTSGAVTSTFVAGVWTASGAIADVNALLGDVTFIPAQNYNSSFTIATSVSDGVAPAITGMKNFITASAANSYAEDTVPPDLPDNQDIDENSAVDSEELLEDIIENSQQEEVATLTVKPLSASTRNKSVSPTKSDVASASSRAIESRDDSGAVDSQEADADQMKDDALTAIIKDKIQNLIQNKQELLTSMEMTRDSIDTIEKKSQFITKAIVGGTLTLSVGLATWVLRVGSLVSSVLSTIPIWKGFDPLPVLPLTEKERRRKIKDLRRIDEEEQLKNKEVSEIFDDGKMRNTRTGGEDKS